MANNLLTGTLVRLRAFDVEADAASFARWSNDSEYLRLLDTDPARPRSTGFFKAELERWTEREGSYCFAIQTLADGRLIGFVGLWAASRAHAEGGVGIGLGEREYWGQGYGTDAMRITLRYAFDELGFERVTLQAFADNARAIRSYEKAGFVLEGVEREWLRRDGRRCDVVTMGVLRDEWRGMEV